MRKEIVIVGGGTAGWLTALTLKKITKEFNITLIESDEVDIVGVGEGSTPNFPLLLKVLDISFVDFIKKTNATHKLGISFENWSKDGGKYFHPFTTENKEYDWSLFNQKDISKEYLGYIAKENLNIDDIILNSKLAYENKTATPFTTYALHFDSELVSKFLKNIGIERGIKVINDTVIDVINNDKKIKSLSLKSGKSVNLDFVFDCSGFKRLLIGDFYKTNWISYENKLKVNKAITFFQPQYSDKIEPYTKAIAMNYGWMWMIPLQNRIGCGYNFDSSYISVEDAKKEVENYFGSEIEFRKEIDYKAGRFENVWVENCIAVGLSSAFTEPIEATSIFNAINQLSLISEKILLKYFEGNTKVIKDYNQVIALLNDDIVDFLQFHYFTNRTDTEFWKNYYSSTEKSDKLKRKMTKWNKELPNSDDFPYESFGLLNWILVGIGLDIFKKENLIKEYRESSKKEKVREQHRNIITQNDISNITLSEFEMIKKILSYDKTNNI